MLRAYLGNVFLFWRAHVILASKYFFSLVFFDTTERRNDLLRGFRSYNGNHAFVVATRAIHVMHRTPRASRHYYSIETTHVHTRYIGQYFYSPIVFNWTYTSSGGAFCTFHS